MNTAFCHMPVLWHPRGEKRITERRRERREGREKERGEESSAELSQIHNKCISCFDMHVPQVKIKLSGSVLQPGWWEQLLQLTFRTWTSDAFFRGLKHGCRWRGCFCRKADEDRRETKSEPGQQEPTVPVNPTHLARIMLGDGGLSQTWVSLPATVLTLVQSSATN